MALYAPEIDCATTITCLPSLFDADFGATLIGGHRYWVIFIVRIGKWKYKLRHVT